MDFGTGRLAKVCDFGLGLDSDFDLRAIRVTFLLLRLVVGTDLGDSGLPAGLVLPPGFPTPLFFLLWIFFAFFLFGDFLPFFCFGDFCLFFAFCVFSFFVCSGWASPFFLLLEALERTYNVLTFLSLVRRRSSPSPLLVLSLYGTK